LRSVSEDPALAVEEPRLPASDTAIRAEGLSVTYRTAVDKRPTLKKTLIRLGRRERTIREIRALREVSFEVRHGTALGIVGVNGAGKSTLLRTVAGILPPTQGRVEVFGRISTLLALGVGFNNDLTGRENVMLGALAAGLTRGEIAAKYDEIAEFSELGDFLDVPIRTYSSGMYGRLALSVALNLEPDILLIDEALSVGDARFRQKSFSRMRDLCGEARTIVIVSHGLRSIRKLCNDAIWMHEGGIAMRDDPEAVVEAYKRFLDVGGSDVLDNDA
jgi:teichoic acid transport system ATP-binding protein